MKIGDYVTLEAIKNQGEHRWVVLTNLAEDDDGMDGGTIEFMAHTRAEAGKVYVRLNTGGTPALLVCGSWEPLSVGGVFVE